MDNLFTFGSSDHCLVSIPGSMAVSGDEIFHFFGIDAVLLVGRTCHSMVCRFSTWRALGIIPDDQCHGECCLKSGLPWTTTLLVFQ